MSISHTTTATADKPEKLEIESLFVSDNSGAEKRLAAALAEHQHHASDMARLALSPLSSSQAMDCVEGAGHVSAYIPVQLSELAKNAASIADFLGPRLCVDPVQALVYEGIWTLGDVVIVYVRADLI